MHVYVIFHFKKLILQMNVSIIQFKLHTTQVCK